MAFDQLTRRQLLQLVGAGAVGLHCGAGDADAEDDAATSEEELTGRRMLMDIDHFVVVMMENRSFDHYFGALRRDKKYANQQTVNGTTGKEWNPSAAGKRIEIHAARTFTLQDPPHSFAASHRQFNDGKNDRFVIANEGPHETQAMAFYDRSQIPFYYWLADHFTVCDNWHASVMGPTMPNRLYLHTGTSAGLKINDPIKVDPPKTIWEHLAGAGVSAKNYFAGRTAQIAHALPTKAKAGKIPVAKIDDFFTAAKNGTLPSVSFIDPEYGVNDDHPDHDVRLGQAFVKSVYKALAKSPQWSKSLLIVIYDEHGGFYDHVPPGVAPDEHEDFRRYGFRVPAMIAGPTVRTGYLATRRFDHTSVLATLAARFKLGHISKRTSNANLITHVLDPQREGRPAPPPLHPPPTRIDRVALATIGTSSQPEMDVAIDDGEVPAELVDQRTLRDRVESWLQTAEALGAVERDDAAHHWGEMSAPELSPSEL